MGAPICSHFTRDTTSAPDAAVFECRPPTAPQYLDYLSVRTSNGRNCGNIAFDIIQTTMDYVLINSRLTEPSAPEKTLSSHMADTNFGSINRKLLKPRYPTASIFPNGFVANSGESFNK